MNWKRVGNYLILFFGISLSLIGAALIYGYVMEAIIHRRGEPDQSLLFWYLPLLLFGFFGLAVGLGTSVAGISRLKKSTSKIPPADH